MLVLYYYNVVDYRHAQNKSVSKISLDLSEALYRIKHNQRHQITTITMEEVNKYKVDIMAYLKTKENEPTIIDILNKLQTVPMTIGILTETKLGIALAKLRKEGTEAIAKLSADLIAQWKSLVTSTTSSEDKPAPELKRKRAEDESDGKDVKRRTDANEHVVKLTDSGAVKNEKNGTSDSASVKSEVKTEAKSEAKSEVKSGHGASNGVKSEPKFEILTTTDPARIQAIKKFADALKKQPSDPALLEAAERVAAEIEEELFFMYKGITKEYKDKFRSLWFNINDNKNQQLRDRLLTADISANLLCNMSNAELANPELQKEMVAIKKQNEKNVLRGVKEATCTQFTCSKCKQNKTTYFQMQTRSADEPMTTFVECINCGNRWKFC